MKTIFALIILCCLVTACSTTYVVSSSSEDTSIDEFNNFVQGQVAEIILRDSIVNNATDVYLSADSLSWNDSENILKNSAVKSDVSKVIISSKLIGGLEWWGIGMLAGGIAGYLTFLAIGGGSVWAFVFIVPAGVVVGALAGITTGIIIGHSYEFIIFGY